MNENSGFRRAMETAKKSKGSIIAHGGQALGTGALLLMLMQAQAADIKTAQIKADTAIQKVSKVEGTVEAIDANLRLFMQMQGVKPVAVATPETVFVAVPVLLPDSTHPADSTAMDSSGGLR
ncbi:MAG: hypothetical protein AB1752_13490 [Candidatus Zixiibacteriota bacterium]